MSAVAARLALLRHGPTGWNRAGRIQGRTDQPLDSGARAEAAALALPAPWNRARLVASPLRRAVETAELIAGRKPEIVPELIEMDWGDWEGQQGVNLRADPASGYRDIDYWGLEYRPPGGESVAELRRRVRGWLARAAEEGGDWIAVCHIGVMRVILGLAHGWEFSGPAPFRVRRRRLYPLALDAEGAPFAPEEPVRLIAREDA